MSSTRPSSNKKPGDQSSKTPSGKTIPMAMSMMVDSMVRMIQKANNEQENKILEDNEERVDEY
tara:strand:+ start:939 stop:1127 length:189 start_codon:yes stop_codon:yes gene_type:complete